jgi:excisionase family DNA binding protein
MQNVSTAIVLLTTKEVAQRLRCHRTTVQRLIDAKKLAAVSVTATGRRKQWRITEASLTEFLLSGSSIQPVERKKSDPQIVSDPFPLLRRYSKKLGKQS